MERVIANRAPVARNVARGSMQLMVSLVSFISVWFSIRGIAGVTLPPEELHVRILLGFLGGLGIISTLPFACRNFHRLVLRASVTADDKGLAIRIPRAPFGLCPFYKIVEHSISWDFIRGTNFAAGSRCCLILNCANENITIGSGHFESSLYSIEKEIRSAALGFGKTQLKEFGEPRDHKGTPRTILVSIGFAAFAGYLLLIMSLTEGTHTPAKLLYVFAMIPFSVMVMGFLPRRAVRLDERGFFLEETKHITFIPWRSIEIGNFHYKTMWLGMWLELEIGYRVDGKQRCLVLNQILGFGYPLARIYSEMKMMLQKQIVRKSSG